MWTAPREARNLALFAPGQETLSFEELQRCIDIRCARLRRSGVTQGTRVAILTGPGLDTLITLLALLRCAVAIPLNPGSPPDELARALKFLKADFVIGAQDKNVAALAITGDYAWEPWTEPVPPDNSLALVMQTSGTEGDPKRVPLTRANLRAAVDAVRVSMHLGPSDRFLCLARPHHIAGLTLLLASLDAGSATYFVPGLPGNRFLDAFSEFQPTWFWAAPAILVDLLRRCESPENARAFRDSKLRFIRSGSAPLPPPVLEGVETLFGVPVLENYGMTEAAPQITTNPLPPGRRKPGSAGVPAGPEVRIASESGITMPLGSGGEVQIRGASVTSGYEDDPAANSEAFVDGWFRTGDIGYLDAEGYLFLCGRRREAINRGGEKVWPREVEEVLLAHPRVSEAVVFPVPHPVLFEDVAAAVISREGATEPELRGFAGDRLAGYKVPSRIHVVTEIPKGPGGKPRRRTMAEQLGLLAKATPYAEPSTPAERQLAAIWARVLRVEHVGANDNFFDLGGDSLAVTEMFNDVVSVFGRGDGMMERHDFFYSPVLSSQARLLAEPLSAAPALPPEAAYVSPAHAASFGAWRADDGCPPVFAFPWADSDGTYLAELATTLGDDWPFCVLANPDPEGRPYSIEDLAERYAPVIRGAQPEGPYVLAGHCFGGIVAYEVARRLRQEGQEVRLLAIFDAPTPGYPEFIRHASRFASGTVFHLRQALASRQVKAHLQFALGALLRHIRKHGQGSVERVAKDVGSGSDRRAMRMYRPQPLDVPAIVLVARNHPQTGSPLDRRLGWRELIHPRPIIETIEGDHGSILSGGQVAALAGRLREVLEPHFAKNLL